MLNGKYLTFSLVVFCSIWLRSNSDVIMFDVDITRWVALLLKNILHLKHFEKCPSPKLAKKALWKILILLTLILIWIEFTAYDKIEVYINPFSTSHDFYCMQMNSKHVLSLLQQ